MEDEIKKSASAPSAPVTEVNQYGDRPVYVGHANNINVYDHTGSAPYDDNGTPFVPIVPTRYDHKTKTIVIGNESVTLSAELIPIENVDPVKLPYINALCEVYAERLERAIDPSSIDTMPASMRRNLAEQRKAYYSAEWVKESVRGVFADGESQFDVLKSDVYHTIVDTYYDDRHESGYDRLLAVLDKITRITPTQSSLINIVGLIGSLEKKGICHMLVNDETIKSWVNIDE